jgi:hypothetical protein
MKVRCLDGETRRFIVAKNDGEDGQTRIAGSREARCLECGESLGSNHTKILRLRFREHMCLMNGRSWVKGGIINGQIMEFKY